MERPVLASLEFVVEDLDKALELFVDLMGLEFLSRSQHPSLAAEVVMLSAGPVAITILHPTDDPDRMPLASPEPRMAQMVFMIDSDEHLLGLRDRMIEAGAGVMSDSPQMFHLGQSMIEGLLGKSPVPVFLVPPEQPKGS